MTRYSSYRGDKMSRLAPSSELVERHSPCGIRGLAESVGMARILLEWLAYYLSKSSLGC